MKKRKGNNVDLIANLYLALQSHVLWEILREDYGGD